jgi:hypothetical protein
MNHAFPLLPIQMSAIVRALNVKPCGCTDCGIAQKLKIGDLQQCQSHNGHLTNGFAATADNRQVKTIKINKTKISSRLS